MSNTTLAGGQVPPFVSAESLSSVFAATATLATAGATIPANTSGVWVKPSAAAHWNPVGAATTTFMHTAAANEWFFIKAQHVGTAQIIGDAGAITAVVVYMRGSRRADGKETYTRPY